MLYILFCQKHISNLFENKSELSN